MNEYYYALPSNPDLGLLKKLVSKCENEVFFESTEGDRIALKSTLGQYLFFTIVQGTDFLNNSCIHCFGDHDKELLSDTLIYIEK